MLLLKLFFQTYCKNLKQALNRESEQKYNFRNRTMSKEQKPDHEQETLENTLDPWVKNAEDHYNLGVQIATLGVKVDQLSKDMTEVKAEQKEIRNKLDSLYDRFSDLLKEQNERRDKELKEQNDERKKELKEQNDERKKELQEQNERRDKELKEQNDERKKERREERRLILAIVGLFLAVMTFFISVPYLQNFFQLS